MMEAGGLLAPPGLLPGGAGGGGAPGGFGGGGGNAAAGGPGPGPGADDGPPAPPGGWGAIDPGAPIEPSAHWALREFRPGEPAAALTVSVGGGSGYDAQDPYSLPGSPHRSHGGPPRASPRRSPTSAMIPTPHQDDHHPGAGAGGGPHAAALPPARFGALPPLGGGGPGAPHAAAAAAAGGGHILQAEGPGPLGLRLKRTPSMTRLFREHVAAFKERQQDAISLAFPPQPPPPAHTVFQPHVPGLGGPPPPAQGLYGGLAGPMQYGGGYQYPTVVLPRGMVGPGRRGQASPQPSAGGMKSFGSGSPSRKRGGGGYGGGHGGGGGGAKKAGAHGGPAGPPVPAGPKMKASNFTGSSLRVGTWKKDSVYEGDLVAKFYYAKRKLVWEVLEAGLKSKIEVLWDSVTSLKCHIARGAESYLEVEVNAPPAMYRESNPQPRKHTIWQPCPDFTDGQAAVATVHCVTFPAGVLNKHYYKLLQCEPRLAVLAAKSGSPTLAGDSFFKPAELSSSPPPLVEEDSSKGASCEEADSEQVPLKKGAADAPGALPSPHRASARPKRAAARGFGERMQAAGLSKKPKTSR